MSSCPHSYRLLKTDETDKAMRRTQSRTFTSQAIRNRAPRLPIDQGRIVTTTPSRWKLIQRQKYGTNISRNDVIIEPIESSTRGATYETRAKATVERYGLNPPSPASVAYAECAPCSLTHPEVDRLIDDVRNSTLTRAQNRELFIATYADGNAAEECLPCVDAILDAGVN